MRSRPFVLPLLLLLSLAPLPSYGKAASDEAAKVDAAKKAARKLADQGFELFKDGKFEEAIVALRDADALFHAPTLLLLLARAYTQAGKLVAAKDTYQRIVDEPVEASAPDAFREAQGSARTELAALEPRIPRVELAITGASLASTTVLIDGSAISQGALGQPIALDPGSHTITASAGEAPATRGVVLAEGQVERLAFDFTVRLPADARGAPTPALRAVQPRIDERATRAGSIVPGLVGLGVGAVGLGVGAVAGALAMGKANELKDKCVDDHCFAGDKPLADSASGYATISTVGFIVGGVGVAAGVVLLVTRPGGKSAPATIGVVVRPGSIAVQGAF